MIFACRLRLYTDEDRLITGKPRLSRSLPSQSASQISSDDTHPKAMNYQFASPTDLNVNNQPSNNHPKQRKAWSLPRQDRLNQRHSTTHNKVNSELTPLPGLSSYETPSQPINRQNSSQDNNSTRVHPMDLSPLIHSSPSSQLDLILAKLSELDVIKSHLTNLDNRLNQIQPPSLIAGLLANHS